MIEVYSCREGAIPSVNAGLLTGSNCAGYVLRVRTKFLRIQLDLQIISVLETGDTSRFLLCAIARLRAVVGGIDSVAPRGAYRFCT